MATLILWLLCAATLCVSTGAQEAYDRLPASFKKGVDLALEERNARPQGKHLFLYFKGLMQSDIDDGSDVLYIYHNFYMKATRCLRGTVDTSNCPFRDNKPEVDCAICYKTVRGEIQASPEPYIHCIAKTALTEEITRVRVNHCNRMGSVTGAPGGLADRTGDY